MGQKTVLLADDEDTLRMNLAEVMREEGFDVIACADGQEALKALKANSIDVLITDLRMPGLSGMDLIDRTRKLAPAVGIIVITAFGEVETAVEAMRKGAKDYLCKPLNFDELIFKLKQLISHEDLARQNELMKQQLREASGSTDIVADSSVMKAILETIERIAQTLSNVLLCGESGTGKEVLARALHYGGITRDRPFVAVNCGGLTETLMESEFFGHRRGSFTGAEKDRVGYFEAADGGTLFLDEIGNLPFKSQSVLLRAIEQRAIIRVGDTRPRRVNLRIIAATNTDLEKAIAVGAFREDLYFRLNVVRLTVPPLRERTEDIAPLIEHFIHKYNSELQTNCPGMDAEAIEALCAHAWRGNVRELENVVERALIFAGSRRVGVEDLSFAIGKGPPRMPLALDLRSATRQFERQHIVKVLASFGNNKNAAADALGIGLSSLYRKMDELGIAKALCETGSS